MRSILYYDKAPLCKNISQARAKWNLTFAYEHNLNFHRQVSSYFMKDDHDTLKNDSWPGQTYGNLTFDQGLEIFREQVPIGEKTYHRYFGKMGGFLAITVKDGKAKAEWMSAQNTAGKPNVRHSEELVVTDGEISRAWVI